MAKDVPEICKTYGTRPSIKHMLSECRQYTIEPSRFFFNLDKSLRPHSNFEKPVNDFLKNANIYKTI